MELWKALEGSFKLGKCQMWACVIMYKWIGLCWSKKKICDGLWKWLGDKRRRRCSLGSSETRDISVHRRTADVGSVSEKILPSSLKSNGDEGAKVPWDLQVSVIATLQ